MHFLNKLKLLTISCKTVKIQANARFIKGISQANTRIYQFLNVTLILCYSEEIIVFPDAQYAIFGGKFERIICYIK